MASAATLNFDNSTSTQAWNWTDVSQPINLTRQQQSTTPTSMSNAFQVAMKWLSIVVGTLGL